MVGSTESDGDATEVCRASECKRTTAGVELNISQYSSQGYGTEHTLGYGTEHIQGYGTDADGGARVAHT